MRRSVPSVIVVVAGLLLLVNFIVINPLLAATSAALLELIVLLSAAAAVAGGIALGMRSVRQLAAGDTDRWGAAAVIGGLGAMLFAGFYPGSAGASDPAVRWLVAALLAPLVASLFALLFVFLLRAARRGVEMHPREIVVMLSAALAVVVLLLPLDGPVGSWLAAAAGWSQDVPIAAVFRGLLIGVGIATAVHAARILLAVDADG
jgi:hypothetical protein